MFSRLLAQVSNTALPTSVSGVEFFQTFLPFLISFLIIVGIVLFVGMLLVGGFEWLKSQGDKNEIEAARLKLTNALVGIIILFSIFAIVNMAGCIFGINPLEFNIGPYSIGFTGSPLCPVSSTPIDCPGGCPVGSTCIYGQCVSGGVCIPACTGSQVCVNGQCIDTPECSAGQFCLCGGGSATCQAGYHTECSGGSCNSCQFGSTTPGSCCSCVPDSATACTPLGGACVQTEPNTCCASLFCSGGTCVSQESQCQIAGGTWTEFWWSCFDQCGCNAGYSIPPTYSCNCPSGCWDAVSGTCVNTTPTPSPTPTSCTPPGGTCSVTEPNTCCSSTCVSGACL